MRVTSLFRGASLALTLLTVLTFGDAEGANPKDHRTATAVLPTVEVNALRDPVVKSYRKIVKGMELFERRHSLAPNAPLRFKLLPRSRNTNMKEINLGIVGESVSIPVPVAADNTFTLERSEQALEEDALVIPNRTVGSMTWRADIRTPGLPPDTRRLGDLRLECLVGMEADLVSRIPPEYLDRLLRTPGYCERRQPHYLFFADRPLFSVTLVAGGRREVLSVDDLYAGVSRDPMTAADLRYCDCEVLLDRTYYAPIGDPSWPDDTLIEFEYMDAGVASAAAGSDAAARDML